MADRKHVALTEEQAETFREAKLRLQQDRGNPDLDDNETVELLAEHYLGETENQHE